MAFDMFISTLKVEAQYFFETLVSICKVGPILFPLNPLVPHFFYLNELNPCTHIYIIVCGELTRN
jgi:hypothetical protein